MHERPVVYDMTRYAGRNFLRFFVFCGLFLMTPAGGAGAQNIVSAQHPLTGGKFEPPPRGAWCGDYRFNITERQRFSGMNLQRLQAAQMELAPGFAAGAAKTELYLLADYQAELGKRLPDTALAASYLALASAVPITTARYRQVNALLCVSTTPARARAIQAAAEAMRAQEAR